MTPSPMSSTQEPPTPTRNFKAVVNYFKIGGIAGMVFGLIHAGSMVAQGATSLRLGDALFNMLLGVTLLGCSWLVSKGKGIVIGVFVLLILSAIVYSFAVGRGFNFVAIILGAGFTWELLSLRKKGEIR